MTACVVIGILATLLIPVISSLAARAQRASCTANLRTLYVATESYVQQNGSWPQIPITDSSDEAQAAYAKAWIAALSPFGPGQRSWICPTVQHKLHDPDLSKPENIRIDYRAVYFDDKPITPHKWPRMPWFAETQDVHGNGQLIIFTDGSVSDLKTVAAQAQQPR
jgi:type II secretory pathway pseudopilin PulG